DGDSDFSARWRDIKKTFSRSIDMRYIWQPRFWEHTIRNEEDYRRHVDYIYINPLKHGYVGKVSDWPYSTFHRDVAQGLYPVDWAGEIEDFAAGERK
ncbi:MAG: transposase, partial [Enterobacter sp.]|nr:transposase [Enterobacter sp.]